jgi:hypothetical protein
MILMLFVGLVASVRMSRDHFAHMVDSVIQMRMIPIIPTTESDYHLLESMRLVEAPDCPFSNHVYSCDANGRLSRLTLTAPTLGHNMSLEFYVGFSLVDCILTIRNFVGVLRFYSSMAFLRNLTLVDSTLLFVPTPFCKQPTVCDFIVPLLTNATSLVLRNVTLFNGDDRYMWSQSERVPDSVVVGLRDCQFENVQMACPIPQWLAHCFNASDVASVPCISPPQNSSAFRVAPPVHDCQTHTFSCVITCTPPPATGFVCNLTDHLRQGYFPETPGFATIELAELHRHCPGARGDGESA